MDIRNGQLTRARQLLASALQLLDDAHAPAEIGAHVDQAIVMILAVTKEDVPADPMETHPGPLSRGSDATH